MTLQHTRHRIAKFRNDLHAELAKLKTSSSAFKNLKNRIGGVMDCIEICDQDLLAEEQGEPTVLRPDQMAWLAKRRGECPRCQGHGIDRYTDGGASDICSECGGSGKRKGGQ